MSSKNLEKRRNILDRAKRELAERRACFEKIGPGVPPDEWAALERAEAQVPVAEKLFSSLEGEYEVGRVDSLTDVCSASERFSGLKSRAAGWNNHERDMSGLKHERWADDANKLKAENPTMKKLEIARAVAEQYGENPETVRDRLYKKGVF